MAQLCYYIHVKQQDVISQPCFNLKFNGGLAEVHEE